MADHSHIEWTDATWNPITGCSVISPGCTNCYAMKLAGGRLRGHPSRADLTAPSKSGPVWTGEVRLNEAWLTQPLQWTAPRRIFVCAHGDLFHEAVPDAWIDKVFAVMALAPQHTFQALTKRAERMRAYMTETWQPAPAHRIEGFGLPPIDVPPETVGEDRRDQVDRQVEEIAERAGLLDTNRDDLWDETGSPKCKQYAWPLPNVWLGVSAEDQTRLAERWSHLRATPATKRFFSFEPLLGPIDATDICNGSEFSDALNGCRWHDTPDDVAPYSERTPAVDWVIVGGESGPGARPMHPDWARKIRDDCAAAGVPFFFKQWGEWGFYSSAPSQAVTYGDRRLAVFPDGRRSNCAGPKDADRGVTIMSWFGKKAAGRQLDGRTHDAMPD